MTLTPEERLVVNQNRIDLVRVLVSGKYEQIRDDDVLCRGHFWNRFTYPHGVRRYPLLSLLNEASELGHWRPVVAGGHSRLASGHTRAQQRYTVHNTIVQEHFGIHSTTMSWMWENAERNAPAAEVGANLAKRWRIAKWGIPPIKGAI